VLSCSPEVLVVDRLLNWESLGEDVITAEVELATVQWIIVLLYKFTDVLSAQMESVTLAVGLHVPFEHDKSLLQTLPLQQVCPEAPQAVQIPPDEQAKLLLQTLPLQQVWPDAPQGAVTLVVAQAKLLDVDQFPFTARIQ
jgi:hypothetical protein